jgi:hypothetical protein
VVVLGRHDDERVGVVQPRGDRTPGRAAGLHVRHREVDVGEVEHAEFDVVRGGCARDADEPVGDRTSDPRTPDARDEHLHA